MVIAKTASLGLFMPWSNSSLGGFKSKVFFNISSLNHNACNVVMILSDVLIEGFGDTFEEIDFIDLFFSSCSQMIFSSLLK